MGSLFYFYPMQITLRKGETKDVKALLTKIKALAEYEKAPEQVEVTEEELLRDGFGPNKIYDFFVAENDTTIVGIALYYFKYSTWKGKALYLEDIIVDDNMRRYGIGKMLFTEVCRVAHNEKCRRMDWQVLEWNEPAIQFYKKMGAKLDPEWVNGQLFKADLEKMFS